MSNSGLFVQLEGAVVAAAAVCRLTEGMASVSGSRSAKAVGPFLGQAQVHLVPDSHGRSEVEYLDGCWAFRAAAILAV